MESERRQQLSPTMGGGARVLAGEGATGRWTLDVGGRIVRELIGSLPDAKEINTDQCILNRYSIILIFLYFFTQGVCTIVLNL